MTPAATRRRSSPRCSERLERPEGLDALEVADRRSGRRRPSACCAARAAATLASGDGRSGQRPHPLAGRFEQDAGGGAVASRTILPPGGSAVSAVMPAKLQGARVRPDGVDVAAEQADRPAAGDLVEVVAGRACGRAGQRLRSQPRPSTQPSPGDPAACSRTSRWTSAMEAARSRRTRWRSWL